MSFFLSHCHMCLSHQNFIKIIYFFPVVFVNLRHDPRWLGIQVHQTKKFHIHHIVVVVSIVIHSMICVCSPYKLSLYTGPAQRWFSQYPCEGYWENVVSEWNLYPVANIGNQDTLNHRGRKRLNKQPVKVSAQCSLPLPKLPTHSNWKSSWNELDWVGVSWFILEYWITNWNKILDQLSPIGKSVGLISWFDLSELELVGICFFQL